LIAVDPASGQQSKLSSGGSFSDPAGVAFLPDGRLLVSDLTAFGGGGGLIVVDPDSGVQHKAVAATEFNRPFGIAVEPGGRVIVAYMQRPGGHGDVLEVDLQTAEHRLIVPDADLFEPAGVALEPSGDVIVTEPDESGQHSRLHRLMRSGIQHVLRDGPAGHIYGGVAVDANGDILVAASMVHDPGRVLRFDRTGQNMHTIAAGGNLAFPIGIALDHGGAILIANSTRNVIRIDPAGGAQTPVSSGGSLESPTGVAIR
jgi:DNA-binding beta-propeller fold protein YncE